MSCKKDLLLVAAIDFGTTYSGYAFSFKHEFEKDPLKISINQNWVAGSMSLVSLKAPTCILFDPEGNFSAFGYEAEDKYSELALDNEHHDHYFFSRFKMLLHEKGLRKGAMLKDDKGKEMEARKVFSMGIRFLKGHLLETLEKRGTGMDNKDIHWVVTVPAIWTDQAKQFMREAASDAGIDGDQLSIALEPEAASLYCQLLPTEKLTCDGDTSFVESKVGSKYMVIDLGGGTADITVHEKQVDGTLKELIKASGGAWGGTKVDDAFDQLLIGIVGAPIYKIFNKKFKVDAIDLYRELETKKRTITPETSGKVTVKIPVSFINEFEEDTNEKIKDVTKQGPHSGRIEWVSDKMRLESDVFKKLFAVCTDKLVEHVKDILMNPEVCGTSTFLMVGGFSESPMVQAAIKSNFPGMKVIIPEGAGLAVLKGAVLFGHKPQTITTRVSKYSYGINISPPFDERIHPQDKRVEVDGVARCKDIFKIYVKAGQPVNVGEAVTGRHVSIKKNQNQMLLKVFSTTEVNPKFVTDDNCQILGRIVIDLPESDSKLRVEVKMIFGETELMVAATEQSTGSTLKSYFDFN